MNSLKMFLPLLVVACFLQGCSVRSSQLSSIIETFNPSVELEKNAWTVNYGEYRATVYAVAVKDGTLFSNEFGDQLLFNGWYLKKITGLGIRQANWKVADRNKNRQFFHGNLLVAEHLCGPWLSDKRPEMIRYSQECKSFTTYNNNIIVNDKGAITLIKQIVDGSKALVTLSKNK